MLLLLDFDGTITSEDTLDVLVQRYAPAAWELTEQELQAGRMTLEQVITYQFERVQAELPELLALLRASVSIRPGLADLLDFCRERFIDPVVVSAGFHELIEPLLADHGVALPVIANHATFTRAGATVHLHERAVCDVCGERCKRVEVSRLAAGRQVGYVGDGWSDRCGAQVADVVFARDSLAAYLGSVGVSYRPFDDLRDVRVGLQSFLATA